MSTLTLKRGDYSLRNQGRGRFGRALSQAYWACRQFLDRVESDLQRNQVRNLSFLQLTPREKAVERKQILRDYKWHKVLAFLLKNKWRHLCYVSYINRKMDPLPLKRAFFFPKERLLGRTLGASLLVFMATGNAEVGSVHLNVDPALVADSKPQVMEPSGPKNWLDGKPELNGFKKDALTGPLTYAKTAGYEFAPDKARLLQLVNEGVLVKLEENESLKFNDVSRPYVLPVVADFVYRLADQYRIEQRCGSLVLNGAARDLKYQATFRNGSEKSVHPAGMAVDFKSDGLLPRCAAWLEGTLLEIEAARRIDVTKEVSVKAPHYHVAVATNEYEAWIKNRQEVSDPETAWLRTALFYEGGPDEKIEGYKAIGWAIKNRVASTEYPNTIAEVVADGSDGRRAGGCQFSFMCDGKPENRYEKCQSKPGRLSSYQRHLCDRRWEKVTVVAKWLRTADTDPTGGAVLYYATWMHPVPDWVVDMKPGTVRRIGNHIFACSLKRGSDACRT